ncbi:MAG TPA: hypothetical protein VMV19_01765 [Xanthobacteraceae bacterium]|nr:hypothetical protein [Xanthobacteraceae bacterium]
MSTMSTALVPIAQYGGANRPGYACVRPQAEFLTLLIAAKTLVPQTRARRRAEPDVAIAAYAVTSYRPLPTGRALSRAA